MGKSILVIDAPESCWGCDLENGHYCGKEKRYIDEEEFETVPDWCPLMDLPEKMEQTIFPKGYVDGWNNGWNACIDEILKGANRNE